jgi:hypothetical protein
VREASGKMGISTPIGKLSPFNITSLSTHHHTIITTTRWPSIAPKPRSG